MSERAFDQLLAEEIGAKRLDPARVGASRGVEAADQSEQAVQRIGREVLEQRGTAENAFRLFGVGGALAWGRSGLRVSRPTLPPTISRRF